MRTPKPLSFIGSKGTILTGQNRAALVDQRCAAPIGWESLSPIGTNRILETAL